MKVRCTFVGCPRATADPFADRWFSISRWGPGVPNGLYCYEHGLALIRTRWSGAIAAEQARIGYRSRGRGWTHFAGPCSGQRRPRRLQ